MAGGICSKSGMEPMGRMLRVEMGELGLRNGGSGKRSSHSCLDYSSSLVQF